VSVRLDLPCAVLKIPTVSEAHLYRENGNLNGKKVEKAVLRDWVARVYRREGRDSVCSYPPACFSLSPTEEVGCAVRVYCRVVSRGRQVQQGLEDVVVVVAVDSGHGVCCFLAVVADFEVCPRHIWEMRLKMCVETGI
jgi:hypothetical protein